MAREIKRHEKYTITQMTRSNFSAPQIAALSDDILSTGHRPGWVIWSIIVRKGGPRRIREKNLQKIDTIVRSELVGFG
jgi:hypothetical protein